MKKLFLFTIFVLLLIAAGCSDETVNVKPRNQKPVITPEIAEPRPRIIAFGDSLSAGFGLPEEESYPFLLQQKIDADGFSYEVINAGVSGETTLGGLERIDWVLEEPNVEILVLELGANDLLRGIPVDQMKANLEKMIQKSLKKNVRVLLCGMLAPPTMGSEYQAQFTNVYPELASKYKLDFLPFILEGVALDPKLNQKDGIHPNAAGEKIMTQNVYKILKPMLSKK